eukprot:scaffold11065_cov115-Cylindrotheca_fusiformis.AAC.2
MERKKARLNEEPDTWFIAGKYQLCTPHWDDGTLDVLKRIAENKATNPIVNQSLDNKNDNDGKRTMSRKFPRNIRKDGPEKNAIMNLWQACDSVAKGINRKWTTFGLVVLRSEAGCRMQAVHEDGIPGQPEIGGLLIAVQEGTKLYIKGVGLKELHVGEVLAFSGSIPHCGADYSELNVRFHANIAEKEEHIPKNKLWKREYPCPLCIGNFNTPQRLHDHLCKGRPDSVNERIRRGNRERAQRHRDKKKLLKEQLLLKELLSVS